MLKSSISKILSDYLNFKKQPFRDNPITDHFYVASQSVKDVVDISKYKIAASRGQGRFAEVPWIGIRRALVAQNFQEGIYAMYLFRADMSGVYLSLALGVSGMTRLATFDRTRTHIITRLREDIACPDNFTTDRIDLRANLKRAQTYEDSIVYSKFYDKNALPSEIVLVDDLKSLLYSYDKVRSVNAYVGSFN